MDKSTMWTENLYQPFEILLREHDNFPIGKHQHSFFEMVYILNGCGTFKSYVFEDGDECIKYNKNDLFLIPPETPHLFTIENHSNFIFIRFTRSYLSDYINCNFENCLEMQSGFHVSLSENDSEAVSRLMEIIASEVNKKGYLSGLLLQNYVNSIILICTRNLSDITYIHDNINNNKPQYMLQYIQQHINQPELLKLDILANKFNISPSYAGRFFKRYFGEDYKQYLLKNKLKRVEDMLTNTRMPIKEIAAVMGYSDSCYLNRVFTQYYGITPLQFRKNKSNLYETLKE